MIIGIGTDIIEIERIYNAVKENEMFLKKVFTDRELDQYNMNKLRIESVAGNFAAKEAISKAIGTGFRGFKLSDIEVLRDSLGKPIVKLSTKVEDIIGIENYRFATNYNDFSEMIYYWRSDYRGVFSSDSSYSYGVRPVIKLDSNVVVVGGKGTYEEPYLIDNNNFLVNNGEYYITDRNNVDLKLSGSNNVSDMCISIGSSGCDNYVK